MMKQIFRITTLMLVALACSWPLRAQQSKPRTSKPSRIEVAQKQASRIADDLALSDETRDRFVATFVNCQQEIWSINRENRKCKAKDALTDAQADSLIRARFDHAQRVLDSRRRYYDEYRKFLSPRQVSRVYELEREIMKHIGEKKRPAAPANPAGGGGSGKSRPSRRN